MPDLFQATPSSYPGVIQPTVDGVYDLGTTNKRWRNLFLTGTVNAPTGVAIDACTYGAHPDRADNTLEIQAAIDACRQAGGGRVVFSLAGDYLALQLVLRRRVYLDGGHAAAVRLLQIAGANRDFIISENFAELTGTTATQPADARVPTWFGLKDIRVSGNAPANTSGRVLAWFGNAMLLLGVVIVEAGAEGNIYTEGGNGSSGLTTFETHEGGYFQYVISFKPVTGCGWLFRGPHNARIDTYYCVLGPNSSWGFRSEETATASGVTDLISNLHVYTDVPTSTGHPGVYLGCAALIGHLGADTTRVEINSTGAVFIDTLACIINGNTIGHPFVWVRTDSVHINHIWALGLNQAGGATGTFVQWDSGLGTVNSFWAFTGSPNVQTALVVAGPRNLFASLYIAGFTAPGSIGLHNTGFANSFRGGLIDSNATGVLHTGTSPTTLDVTIGTGVGQLAVAGTTPGLGDRFNVVSLGAISGGSDVRAISGPGAIDMTLTTVQTITFPHTCLYTPSARNVTPSLAVPVVTDFGVDYLAFVSADATNLTVRVKLRLASATAGSKGDVVAAIRMGA